MEKLKTHTQIISINSPSIKRSMAGFEKFLRTRYVKLRGDGKFIAVGTYVSSTKTLLETLRVSEAVFHNLSKNAVLQLKFNFNDIHASAFKPKHVKDINCAVEAYRAYILYTLGIYSPSKLAA